MATTKYTLDIDNKYIPYLQSKADEEKITIEQMLESAATGIAKSRVAFLHENKVNRKLTVDQKITQLGTLNP